MLPPPAVAIRKVLLVLAWLSAIDVLATDISMMLDFANVVGDPRYLWDGALDFASSGTPLAKPTNASE